MVCASVDYSIEGRQDVVKALHDIHLAPGSEFYPIRRYAPHTRDDGHEHGHERDDEEDALFLLLFPFPH